MANSTLLGTDAVRIRRIKRIRWNYSRRKHGICLQEHFNKSVKVEGVTLKPSLSHRQCSKRCYARDRGAIFAASNGR